MSSPSNTPDACPLKHPSVIDELLSDGSMVLFHKASRYLMSLNPTAALVWEYCDGTRTSAGIADEIRAVFPDRPSVGDDVSAILADLRDRGVLAEDR